MFLISIVATASVIGYFSYRTAETALKNKVGSNAVQVTQGSAADLDEWLGQMDRTYHQVLSYGTQNKFMTKDRRMVLPADENEKNQYLTLVDKHKALTDEINQKMADSEKQTDSTQRLLLRQQAQRLDADRALITADMKKLNQPKFDLDDNIMKYFNSIALANQEMIHSISILRWNNEHHMVTSFSKQPRENVFQQQWVQEAIKLKGSNYFIPPHKGSSVFADEESYVFGIARAVWSPEDTQWADVYIMEFRMSFLQNLVRETTFGGIGDLHIIGPEGQTLYTNRANAKNEDIKVTWTEEAEQEYADHNGQRYLIMHQKLESWPWTVVGTIPEAKLLEDAKDIQKAIIWFVVGGAIFAFLLGYASYRMIGRPLMRTREIMGKAEQGYLNVSLDLRRSDEIGSVGRSFDTMISRIRDIVVQSRDSSVQLLQQTERINDLVAQSQSASKEIATAMQEVSEGSSGLAKDAEQSQLLTIQLNEHLLDVQSKNDRMAEVSRQMEQLSQNGTQVIGQMSEKNSNVQRIVSQLQERVVELQSGVSSIEGVLDWLNDISKKINILSLNASIVAASSGEAGKGFMVVANEIRNLASQSRQSIDSVGEVVSSVREKMQETNGLVQASIPIFKEQTASVNETRQMFGEVENAMVEFKDSFGHVLQSVSSSIKAQESLSAVMLQVSAISEEASATTESVFDLVSEQYNSSEQLVLTGKELEQISQSLTEVLKVFKLEN
jgi:methyl-accepting chemotaxis protein